MCSSLRDEFCVGVQDEGGGATISLEQVFVRQSNSIGFVLGGDLRGLTGGWIMKNCAAVKCGECGIHLEGSMRGRIISKCGDIVDCALHDNSLYAMSASRGCQVTLKNVLCNRNQRCIHREGRGAVSKAVSVVGAQTRSALFDVE